jgi:23S rRNA (cytidine2498-2'-O)-methyltransferase
VSEFIFTVCEPGFEKVLKAEVARTFPSLRPSFARPGMVTFKSDGAHDAASRPSTFARVWGRSMARPTALAEVEPLVRPGDTLHVFARDPADPTAVALANSVDEALRPPGTPNRAEPGRRVLDVIVAPGEPWLVGSHVHGPWRSPEPGGRFTIASLPDSPSRAHAKIGEAIAWADLDVRAGQVVVDIGAAPGGASLALVRAGLEVWAIDPAAMDDEVLAYRHPNGARVHHLRSKIAAVRWEQLPAHVDWLVCDVHLAPQVAIHQLRRIVPALRKRLRGAVITLKLNDLAFVDELPELRRRIGELGFATVQCTHLPSNRQEVCAVAWC